MCGTRGLPESQGEVITPEKEAKGIPGRGNRMGKGMEVEAN